MTTNVTELLPCVEIEPANPAKKSVIWLHGLGADGSDFAPIVPELRMPATASIRFIFPHAPMIPVSINHGQHTRAWFDIATVTNHGKIDTAGISQSVAQIEKLIEREMERGIAVNNILLAGFSQGAAMALIIGLTSQKTLAGIIALSGFLPLPQDVLQVASVANRQTPIFIAHGTLDTVVPYALGKTTYVALKKADYAVTWHSYIMAHTVCSQEIGDISQWMQAL